MPILVIAEHDNATIKSPTYPTVTAAAKLGGATIPPASVSFAAAAS